MPSQPILTAQERRKQKHERMVGDVLTIAREMMQADGVAALSFNAIAHRLGIKPPSLYTYFESKHAIYDTLFRQGFELFSALMEQQIEQAQDLEAVLQTAMRTYMVFALENPDLYQLMFQRPVPGFVPSEASMAVSLGSLERMRRTLHALLANSGIQTTQPIAQTTDLIIAMMHGLTELQLANNPESPVGEGRYGSLIDQAVQVFLNAWQRQAIAKPVTQEKK